MRISANSVEEYLGALPADRQRDLSLVRELIRQVAPDAKEQLSYGMPSYDLNGMLCAFASQKNYMSLYMLNTPVVARHRDSLGKLDVGKGCIRFKKLSDLPLDAIALILRESVEANKQVYNDHC